MATAEDPAAIATIQSAATFTDQPIKYLFKAEGAGGQVGWSSFEKGIWFKMQEENFVLTKLL